jgi:toxin YoeB
VNLLWTPHAWEEYLHWQAQDPELVRKINALLQDISRHPFTGLSKSQPLKGNLKGW